MKRNLIIILFVFSTIMVNSQTVFNRIIEDTVAHITSSIIALDTGYVFLSGTNNEELVRCFALTYINSEGERQWEKTYGDDIDEYWEGHENCLKNDNNNYYLSGNIHKENSELHVFIYEYDSVFNLIRSKIILEDTIYKKSFNIIKTHDDNYFITGVKYDSELDDNYLLLVKTDSLGNYLWKKTYGQRNEFGKQILETSDNMLLLGGATFSFPATVTDQDWYLLKTDTAGNIIWEKGFGNPNSNDGGVKGLIETNDSCYIACGLYPAFENATSNSFDDGCLRKVDKNGELLWTKYYRTYSLYSNNIITMKDCFNSIYEDIFGNLYTLSSTYDSKPFSRGALTKMNSNGKIIYRRLYYAIDEFSNEQYLKVMQPTNDGGFIIAGYGNSYDWYGYDPPQQAWLVKTDSLGLDGLCNSEIPELNFDIEIPTTGCSNDTIEVYAYITGKSAPYTIEFSTGQIIDSIYYPPIFVPVEIGLSETFINLGDDNHYSENITEATLSNHEWGQCIAKPIEFQTPTYNGQITVDITVTDAYGESKTISKNISIHDCGDLIVQENTCPIKLYPNPVRDKVYVDIPLEIIPQNAEIFNSAGQLIKFINVHQGLNVVNVSYFVPGNYIMKIITKDETYNLNFEKK